MPPLGISFSAVTNVVDNVTSFFGAQKPNTSQNSLSHPPESDDGSKAATSGTLLGKRARGSGEAQGSLNKRRDTRSESEKRLLGGWSAKPADAKPVEIPRPDDEWEREVGADTTMSQKKPGAGSRFQPRNTLDSQRHNPRLSVGARLETQRSRGGNVQGPAYPSHADGFVDVESRRAVKKQKTSSGNAGSPTSTEMVDLTHEDSQATQASDDIHFTGVPVLYNGKQLPHPRRAKQTVTSTLPIQGRDGIERSEHSFLQLEKKTRHSNSERRGSSYSSRGTSGGSPKPNHVMHTLATNSWHRAQDLSSGTVNASRTLAEDIKELPRAAQPSDKGLGSNDSGSVRSHAPSEKTRQRLTSIVIDASGTKEAEELQRSGQARVYDEFGQLRNTKASNNSSPRRHIQQVQSDDERKRKPPIQLTKGYDEVQLKPKRVHGNISNGAPTRFQNGIDPGTQRTGPAPNRHRHEEGSAPRMGEAEDATRASLVLDNSRKRTNPVERTKQAKQQDHPRTNHRRAIPQDDLRHLHSSSRTSSDVRTISPPNIRHKFERESLNAEEEYSSKRRASQRMKAESTKQRNLSPPPPRKNVGSSEDELAGEEVTVRSQASVNASPQKSRAVHAIDLARKRKDLPNQEQMSSVASNDSGGRDNVVGGRLRPKHASRQTDVSAAPLEYAGIHAHPRRSSNTDVAIADNSRIQPPGPGQSTHSGEDTDDKEELLFPIHAIYCRGCAREGENLFLVWNHESKYFTLKHEGRFIPLPNQGELVTIGKREAQQWIDASKEDFAAVHIKGSVTENSGGQLVIEFCDLTDLESCCLRLFHASGKTLIRASIPRAKMENVLANKISEYKKFQENQLNSVSSRRDQMALAAMQKRSGWRQEQHPHGAAEQIKYDVDEDEVYLRSRTPPGGEKGARSDEVGGYTTSRFFEDDRRRSTRKTRLAKPKSPPPPPERFSHTNHIKKWSYSVVFPPKGARRVTVDYRDVERLDEGEFLNDNLISFALRQIEENMAPEQKELVHFFNSFFYTALTTKDGKKALNYDAVKKWTKNKDIFACQYVVVPINIDLHWFVAIICNLPELSRKPLLENEEVEEGHGAAELSQGLHTDEHARRSPAAAMDKLSLSDDGQIHRVIDLGDEDNVQASPADTYGDDDASKKRKKKPAPGARKYDPDLPVIITLDSFGNNHSAETKYLKLYLTAEAGDKRGMEVDIKDLQGLTAKGIPEQNNWCDCGVYLVGYIEEFAKDPRKFVTKVLQRELDAQKDFGGFNASATRAKIRDQLIELNEVQEAERKGVKLAAKASEKKPANNSALRPSDQPSRNGSKTPTTRANSPLQTTASNPAIESSQLPAAAPKCPNSVPRDDAEQNDELEMEVPRAFGERPAKTMDTVAMSSATFTAGGTTIHDGDEMLDHEIDLNQVSHRSNVDHAPEEMLEGMLAYADQPPDDTDHSRAPIAEDGISVRIDHGTRESSIPKHRDGRYQNESPVIDLDGMDERELEVQKSSQLPRSGRRQRRR